MDTTFAQNSANIFICGDELHGFFIVCNAKDEVIEQTWFV